jgi:hypothetical protein
MWPCGSRWKSRDRFTARKTAAKENQRVERTAVTGACRSDSKKVLATYASPLGSKD